VFSAGAGAGGATAGASGASFALGGGSSAGGTAATVAAATGCAVVAVFATAPGTIACAPATGPRVELAVASGPAEAAWKTIQQTPAMSTVPPVMTSHFACVRA
jgi:hypothetical protein